MTPYLGGNNGIERDAARAGFYKRLGRGHDHHKTAWSIKCSKCPKEFGAYWNANTSPALMVKNLRVRQWDVGIGVRPLCPSCAHPRADKHPEPKPESQSFAPHIAELPRTKLAEAMVAAGVVLASNPQPPVPSYEELLDRVKLDVPGEVPPSQAAMIHANQQSAINVITEEVDGARTSRNEALAKTRQSNAELLEAQRARAAKAREIRSLRCEERRQRKIAKAAEEVARKLACPVNPTPPPQLSVPFVEIKMSNKPSPTPKITHAVFQQLDAVFDGAKRLYKHGWSDARVAKECGTSEDVVQYLRFETFGELAEDPRIQAIMDDIQLLSMQFDDVKKNTERAIRDLNSRVEQLRGVIARP